MTSIPKNDITDIISRLPQDIKNLIYKEYFLAKLVYADLKKIINSNRAKALYNIELANVLPKVLENDIIVKYLCKQEKEFKFVYELEVISKPDQQVNYYTFASLWLFNLYFKNIIQIPRGLSIRTNLVSNANSNNTVTNSNVVAIQ